MSQAERVARHMAHVAPYESACVVCRDSLGRRPDMRARLVESMETRQPEGITVLVPAWVRTPGHSREVPESLAREVAPHLARRLYADRTIGGVLYVERDANDDWSVTVEDRGPRRFANRTGIEAPG